jgi:Flp pilus assembly protein TadD
MTTTTKSSSRILGLALTTALASTSLAGCAGKAALSAAASADAAREALAKGKGGKAVAAAEAAVLASPRDAATRALLGAAYIEAGRFGSAATALGEAIALGDTSGRTVLSYSLALSAAGRFAEAQTVLARHEQGLDAADYGLAITLAGSPQQGIEVLSNALKYGENGPKLRQNLAYAFALKGDWRSARLLAAQDVSADKLDQRLGEWAQMATPQMQVHRVAALLGVTAKPDAGQPAQLALANFPTSEQLAAEAVAADPAPAPVAGAAFAQADAELPPAAPQAPVAEDAALARYEPAPAPAPVAVSSTPAAPRVVLPRPTVVQPAPARVAARPVAAKPSPAFQAAFLRQPGAYRVQLGSYASASGASEAWTRFQKRHPELKGAERIVTKANVNGKTYYRVAAGGFAKASANAFCSLVRKGGEGCLAYAGALPTTTAKPAVRTAAAKRPTRVAVR